MDFIIRNSSCHTCFMAYWATPRKKRIIWATICNSVQLETLGVTQERDLFECRINGFGKLIVANSQDVHYERRGTLIKPRTRFCIFLGANKLGQRGKMRKWLFFAGSFLTWNWERIEWFGIESKEVENELSMWFLFVL